MTLTFSHPFRPTALALVLAVATPLSAQPTHVPDAEAPPPTPVAAPSPLPAAQLELLVAPIALYPDALVALILPAATVPTDIVLAARYLAQGAADPDQLEAQPWDDAVRGLARYPEVIDWLDRNLEWTRQVGAEFLAQPAETMNAIQRLRSRAHSSGALVDTPQQQVVVEREVIRIVPARPEVIYVPRYDPTILFVTSYRPYYRRPVVTFSVGWPVGPWLAYGCDWHYRSIWVVHHYHRPVYWRSHCDWRHRQPSRPRSVSTVTAVSSNAVPPPPVYQPWQPSETAVRHHSAAANRSRSEYRERPGLGQSPAESGSAHWTRDDRRTPPQRTAFAPAPVPPAESPAVMGPQPSRPPRAEVPAAAPLTPPAASTGAPGGTRGSDASHHWQRRPEPSPAPNPVATAPNVPPARQSVVSPKPTYRPPVAAQPPRSAPMPAPVAHATAPTTAPAAAAPAPPRREVRVQSPSRDAWVER